ncbi:MAG: DUF1592 domain-containing protein, partial [Thermoanaerobaculia bacterium]|nr:DUF1592 domain-containing protein [Thermoanaerobaculia bacterium]
MIPRRTPLLVAVATLATWLPRAGAAAPDLEATLERYCLGCHGERRRLADLSLAGVDGDVASHGAILERVLRKLRAGEMPPPDRPAPPQEEREALVSWLEAELDRAAARDPDPGSPTLHRLNRAEYRNAVRDLLGLDLDHARDLPADDSGYGFDNIGDVLTVSPLHVEKYISAARRISRLAVGADPPQPILEKIKRSPGTWEASLEGLPPGERGGMQFRHFFPWDAEYTLTARIAGTRRLGMPPPRLDIRVDGRRVAIFDADFDTSEAGLGTRLFETRVRLEAGEHEIAAGLLTDYAVVELEALPANRAAVDYVLIGGPFAATGNEGSEVRRRVLSCRPSTPAEERPCAATIAARLARRAYRRPVTEADLEPLLDLYAEGRRDGASFEAGVEMALSGILVSPSFLFRGPAPGTASPAAGVVTTIPDVELASRLSFVLWSSIPDEELLSLAEAGRLSDPDEMGRQVRRMLADSRSRALVDNFGGQWLHLRNVDDWSPDRERFPDFDEV